MPTSAPPKLQDLIQEKPDLVDRIFEYILADPVLAQAMQSLPDVATQRVDEIKSAVRSEFRGEECYIAGRPASARQQMVSQILALFNGRNASEVARKLHISRATVYRAIKQPGVQKNSLRFPGNETAQRLPSGTEATPTTPSKARAMKR
jgi:Mor family transcriptional regulator